MTTMTCVLVLLLCSREVMVFMDMEYGFSNKCAHNAHVVPWQSGAVPVIPR